MDMLTSLNPQLKIPTQTEKTGALQAAPAADTPSFEETLKSFVKDTNEMQMESGAAARQLIAGQRNDIHQVMIMGEKAGIAFNLLLEVRNKLMDGFQEINRMQV